MSSSWSALLAKYVKTSVILLLISNSSWADHAHEHSPAPTFSNPAVLNQVPASWDALPFKHDDAHADADLVVALGQQSYPLFHQLILEYATKNKLKIVVMPGTCGITSGRLRKKSADIGAFCCPPSQSDRLPGLEFHSLGISPIALIVHPDNPLTDISTKQAREIFQGQLSHWTQIDNKQTSSIQDLIKPVARLHCKVRPGHWRGLLKDEDQFSPRLFEVGVIADMISQVSHNTGAIGFEVPVMVSYYKDKGIVRMLKIDGHDATDLEYVLSGKYPLYRSYSLTTWRKNSKSDQLAMKLVKYLQQHVEEIHKEISYIPPSQLKKAGWIFKNDELIGEPASTTEKK